MATATKRQSIHEISIKNITADADIQPRSTIDVDVVREYSDAMLEGDEFPPLSVFYDGITYWLADGFHRYRAAIKAGLAAFRCLVYQGGKDDAVLFSVGANASHGVRRTNADKRRVVLKMLDHPEWCRWSDAEIARRCHVSAGTVTRYRQNSPGVIGHEVTLRIDRNGKLRDLGTPSDEPANDPEPRFKLPPIPLSKAELDEQFIRKIARHLRRGKSQVFVSVETPAGVADVVDGERAYILATAADRHAMFAHIGRAWLIASHLRKSPAIVGHFAASIRPLIKLAEDHGFVICSPESLISESEAAS